jgi:hypothetical protein
MRGNRTRLATGLVLVPVMLVFLAMVGASAFGKPKPSAAQYQYKVTICHHTSSAKNPTVTIAVSSRAVDAHVDRHGDTLGPCPAATTTQAASTGPQGESNGNGNGHGNGSGNGQGNAKGKSK